MPRSNRRIIEGIGHHPLQPAPWMVDALCGDADPDLFFVQSGESGDEAKAICADCLVREPCLNYALQNNERFGIWGGMSFKQRLRVAKGAA